MADHLPHCTMSEEAQLTDTEDLQERLVEVQTLLARHKLVEELVHRQEGPRHDLVEEVVHKQHLHELQAKLEPMHPADIAYVLEALPTDERLIVWRLVNPELEGEVLLEVSDAVRESLIESMGRTELVAAAETLDADELADLAPDLPQGLSTTFSAACRSKNANNCAPRCPTRTSRSARSWTSTWSPCARMSRWKSCSVTCAVSMNCPTTPTNCSSLIAMST
jgi:hypothetical protein